MNTRLKKILVGIGLVGYLLLAVFSLAIVPSHMHTDMDSRPCPYSAGVHTVCSMDVFGHVDGWTKSIQAVIQYTALIFIAVWLYSQKFTVKSILPKRRHLRPERQYSPYTMLFSRGILNPKVP